jgi:membrane associated rhomboid family serine protease
MFPIGDEDPQGRSLPIITWLIIGINALVFLYELTLSPAALQNFFQRWGAVPANITAAVAHPGAPGSVHAFLTLITSQFIHAGWLHIIGNMLFLYVFGDDIEDLLGKVLYPLFYLFCGIVAGLVQTFVLTRFTGDANAPGIGASGAIAGILGAYIVLYPNRRVTVAQVAGGGIGRGSVPALVMLGLWFVQQLLAGVTALNGADTSGVGFWAHIGGFVAGALLILPFRNRARRIIYPGAANNPAQIQSRQYR